ncbi:MAG: sterol carrier family protein [Actinomycetaceae bacterium]|nr:sterol carrier family protein [Arcanobacterium sp.]MDD7687130.1 sterol carrier family protein [Actinomycetaceae bacterium]MDY5273205.1 sterol carrier family protein [Arcanobacterium sp.]
MGSTERPSLKRRIDAATGLALIHRFTAGDALSTAEQRTAVRFALEEFAERYPGHSVEIRVPWIGAVQAISGVNHRRGTPPNVVEMDGQTWLALVTGKRPEPAPQSISYSGAHSDLSAYLPIF